MALGPRALEGLLAIDPQARGPFPGLWDEDPEAPGQSVTADGIAIVPVLGPLLTRGDWLTSLLGATDYGTLGRTLDAAFADPAARAVLLELDSPGGEVGGLFDLVDRIGALRETSGKPLWAVAGEAALRGLCDRKRSRPDLRHAHGRDRLDRHPRRACRRERRGRHGRPQVDARPCRRPEDRRQRAPAAVRPRALVAIQADVDALQAEFCAAGA